jgi:hypothetical protein
MGCLERVVCAVGDTPADSQPIEEHPVKASNQSARRFAPQRTGGGLFGEMRVVAVVVMMTAVVIAALVRINCCGGAGRGWNGHHGGRGEKKNCQEFRFHDVAPDCKRNYTPALKPSRFKSESVPKGSATARGVRAGLRQRASEEIARSELPK